MLSAVSDCGSESVPPSMKKFFIAPASLTTARRLAAFSGTRDERNCSTAEARERVLAFCIAACLPEGELRSISLNSPRLARRTSKFGRPRPADPCGDPVTVRCGAAFDFQNGKTTAAAAATARTVKIKILRIICASFGLVEVRQHSPVDRVRNALACLLTTTVGSRT